MVLVGGDDSAVNNEKGRGCVPGVPTLYLHVRHHWSPGLTVLEDCCKLLKQFVHKCLTTCVTGGTYSQLFAGKLWYCEGAPGDRCVCVYYVCVIIVLIAAMIYLLMAVLQTCIFCR